MGRRRGGGSSRSMLDRSLKEGVSNLASFLGEGWTMAVTKRIDDSPAVEQQKEAAQDLQPSPQASIGDTPRVANAVLALHRHQSPSINLGRVVNDMVVLGHVCFLLWLFDRRVSYGEAAAGLLAGQRRLRIDLLVVRCLHGVVRCCLGGRRRSGVLHLLAGDAASIGKGIVSLVLNQPLSLCE